MLPKELTWPFDRTGQWLEGHNNAKSLEQAYFHQIITLFDYHLIGELMESATFC
jgi:hypothetical protein